ncbi:MAG: hypothetical protein AAAC50_07235 [Rhizobium altiplani]|uniref:hypothetical protein n=1 Tax=Rhizobium altiplani TaxID=1864509 RepID=UPI0030F086A2
MKAMMGLNFENRVLGSCRPDRQGRKSIFSHCKRVARVVEGDDQRIVAYLHHFVEKGRGWTFERLSDEGFNPSGVAAVKALTRRENEGEVEFDRPGS